MDLPTIGESRRTHRALLAWFSSPRIAVRTAFRLLETVPSARVVIDGNNAVFVRNELAEQGPLSGKNLRCNANVVLDESTAGSGVADAGAATAATPVSCDTSD